MRESKDGLVQDFRQFEYYKIDYYSLKNYTKIIKAMRSILEYLRKWFGIMIATDSGYAYVSGINSQVSAINALALHFGSSKVVTINSGLYDWKNNSKLAQWLKTLDKTSRDKLNYFKKHYLKIPEKYRNSITKLKTWSTGVGKTLQEKFFATKTGTALLKQFYKLADVKDKANTKYMNTQFYKKLFDNKSNLDNSLAGTYLSYLMNQSDAEFKETMRDKKKGNAFIASAYTTIATVFNTTRIILKTGDIKKDHDPKKLLSIGMMIGAHKKIATTKALKKEMMFTFNFNSHKQYGDVEAYNYWMDNQNGVSLSAKNDAFANVNWTTLLKNTVLIDGVFGRYSKFK